MKTSASADIDEVIDNLRAEGLFDEEEIKDILLSLQPGGEKEVLPGETREEAIARLMRHYDWDERAAAWTIALSEGWSDVVPLDDDGTPLPYFRVRAEDEAREANDRTPADLG